MSDLFEMYLNEVENYSTRWERFDDAFKHLSLSDRAAILDWMRGSFEAGLDHQ